MKTVREHPAYQLIVPFLKSKGLPYPDEIYAPENQEYALICLHEEGWNKVERQSIIDGNLNSPSGGTIFDEIEAAFQNGEDLYEQLTKRFG